MHSIVTNNRENRLKGILKEHFLNRKHPQHFTDYSLQYFSQNFKLKITIALHSSEPTIPTIDLI